MIKVMGTTHLDPKESIEEIIKKENPDILGVELCESRAIAIFNEVTKEIIETKKSNSLLQKITDKIKSKSKKEGLDYGSDMKTVLRYASNNKIECLLVDMPILKIQELFSKIPLEEQKGFTKELGEFEKQSMSEELNEEEVIKNLKSRYPIAFEFLINMRNLYITNQLLKAKNKYPDKKILVFLGKSHVKQIEVMLE